MSVRLTTHGGAMVVPPMFAGAPLTTTTRSDAAVGLATPRPPAVGGVRASRAPFVRARLSTARGGGPAAPRAGIRARRGRVVVPAPGWVVGGGAPPVSPRLPSRVRLLAAVVAVPLKAARGAVNVPPPTTVTGLYTPPLLNAEVPV